MAVESPDVGWSSLLGPDLHLLIAPDLATVSCAILLKRTNAPDVSEMVMHLEIPQKHLIVRNGVRSVRAAALIQALALGIRSKSVLLESSLLFNLITGTFAAPTTVIVSTTRLPDFAADRYKALEAGYMAVGTLPQIHEDMVLQFFCPTPHCSKGEVPCTLSTGNSMFFSNSFPTADPEFTFILIFSILVDYSFSDGPALQRTSSVASFSSMPSDPSHIQSTNSDYFKADFSDPSEAMARSDLEIPEIFETFSLPDPITEPASVPTRPRSGSVAALLQTLLPDFGVSESALRAARAGKGKQTLALLDRIRNVQGMQDLLDNLDLVAAKHDKDSPPKSFTDSSGGKHLLSGNSILRACDWSSSTFVNKTQRLSKVKKILKEKDWKSNLPQSGDHFQRWSGLVYMFSALGPVSTGCEPNAKSSVDAEQNAAALSQKHLELNAEWISTYLEPRVSTTLST
ncbi:hypothetical protein R3P38DRAFT_3222317 [Favolaschia claudopus]|uniref:Uncharacterized protein n=1 Tax=Favolaschia claudopus TaxID=2862362 RepID=A0AAV9ZYH9_9AGAR